MSFVLKPNALPEANSNAIDHFLTVWMSCNFWKMTLRALFFDNSSCGATIVLCVLCRSFESRLFLDEVPLPPCLALLLTSVSCSNLLTLSRALPTPFKAKSTRCWSHEPHLLQSRVMRTDLYQAQQSRPEYTKSNECLLSRTVVSTLALCRGWWQSQSRSANSPSCGYIYKVFCGWGEVTVRWQQEEEEVRISEDVNRNCQRIGCGEELRLIGLWVD